MVSVELLYGLYLWDYKDKISRNSFNLSYVLQLTEKSQTWLFFLSPHLLINLVLSFIFIAYNICKVESNVKIKRFFFFTLSLLNILYRAKEASNKIKKKYLYGL